MPMATVWSSNPTCVYTPKVNLTSLCLASVRVIFKDTPAVLKLVTNKCRQLWKSAYSPPERVNGFETTAVRN
jgi:hypothetical protein